MKNCIFVNKSSCHENYFELAPNYSFTNLNLKEKRILAFLLSKLIMIPDFAKESLEILHFFQNTYNMHFEKIEDNLCEVLF